MTTPLDDPISESDVLDKYPMLSIGMLRKARTEGTIAWVKGKRNSAWYRQSAVQKFIADYMESPCREAEKHRSLNSPDIGSPESPGVLSFTDIGLSPELVELAAHRCAQKI
jgi:hypothetical protein